MDLMMMERVGDRWGKMEGYCSTGQSPQRAVVSVEEDYGPGVDSSSNRNEYQEYFLGVKVAGV
jgi:hypothetical protein